MTTKTNWESRSSRELLGSRDHEALERCIALTLAEKDQARVQQVRDKLRDESWDEVARFCVYHRQMDALNLRPWEDPPAWIEVDDIDANLATPRHASREAAKLAKRLLDAGLSIYEPDPIFALKSKGK